MATRNFDPPYATNGGLLSNGYQLQHYRPTGNPDTDPVQQCENMLLTVGEEEFEALAHAAQQKINHPRYQIFRQLWAHQPSWRQHFGMPQPPALNELIATGNRDFALAMIEQYRRQRREWQERIDPGGRDGERSLELLDRQCTEEERERRRKRAKRSACVVL